MADTAISVTTLTMNAVSADTIVTAEGGTSVAAGDTAVIDVANATDRVIISLYGSGAATATVQAGDSPLAVRSGLGATAALTVPASDLLLLCLEGARFMHDDGKIRINIATNAVVVGAHRLPKTI